MPSGGLSIDTALASFELPASPARSPVGAEAAVAVWLEATPDGEQRVHMALADASLPPPSALDGTGSSSSSTGSGFPQSDGAFDFPLVLFDAPPAASSSSALVPFQKLQLDTNLNRTLLPYKQPAAAATRDNNSNHSSQSSSSAAGDAAAKKPTQAFTWGEAETHALMTSEFMNALRLGDQPRPQEPQLAVRLRGSRVELASGAEEDDVDFLGPAENIKKLFKLPYSQARVSLAVHRVGSTLVVDGELQDADLPAGFEELPQETLALAQAAERSQSLLYEKFLYESAVQGQLTAATQQPQLLATTGHLQPPSRAKGSKKSHKKAKKRAARDALTRGFALPDASWLGAAMATDAAGRDGSPPRGASGTRAHAGPASGASPAPCSSSPSETPPFSQAFQRVLKWKFHDLKMILGSQVLLFSNKEHPAVSLKLHDMDTDLSLCTVLDYYLDNVIANVPELAICMHSNGLVRGYKLVETRQIPYLAGAARPPLFDIQDVSMNAAMLLKFLQENCARPNGTYWLHRKEGENALRLYDVDVLSEGQQLKWKYMMAMLCYRFASRAARLVDSLARDTPRLQRQLQQRQRELLRTCRKLLREIAQGGGAAHSAICASVSEQLADTYLRECNDPVATQPIATATATATRSGPDDRDSDNRAALLDALYQAKEHLLESIRSFEECMVPERAASSLPHENDNDNDDNDDREEAPTSPGRREQDDAGGGADDPRHSHDGDDDDEMHSFMDDERARLQLKCASVSLQLGQVHAKHRDWAEALAAVVGSCEFLPLRAVPEDVAPLSATPSVRNPQIDALLERLDFDGVGGARRDAGGAFICTTGSELRSRVLELVGDIAAQLPANQTEVLQGLYRVVGGEQRELLPSLSHPKRSGQWMDACQRAESCRDDAATTERGEELLALSFYAYLRALAPSVDSELYFMLMKKLGNASNELGKFFLEYRRDYVEAFTWFERGCKIFSEIEDGINVALLFANLAHLHKILAQGKSSAPARQVHYEAAIQLCRDALQQLRQNKAAPELHRKVKGELALTFLVWAVSLANDCARGDADKPRENAAHKTFSKALALYLELGDRKQVASTHYQMASFHSRTISRDLQLAPDDGAAERSPLTSRMEIARRHYEKALAYFGRAEVGQTFVLIHHELADLYAVGGRAEDVEHALLVMLNTYDAFSHVSGLEPAARGGEHAAMLQLAGEVVAKVKLILHQLIRLTSTGTSSGSNGGTGGGASAPSASAKRKKLEMFKKMYKEVIYYDGRKGSGIAPMLGTLRSMYLL